MLFSALHSKISSFTNDRNVLLSLYNERAFLMACQSITTAYVISILQMCGAVQCLLWEPMVSISLLEQNAFVMHSFNLSRWRDIISVIVLLEEMVLWHQKENTDTSLQTLSVYSEHITDGELSVHPLITEHIKLLHYSTCKPTWDNFTCVVTDIMVDMWKK